MGRFKWTPALLLTLALLGLALAFAATDVFELRQGKKVIGVEAFCGDRSIERVVVPDGTERIEARAFADSSLKIIELPDTVEYIAEDAFEGSSLEKVFAPEGSYARNWGDGHGYLQNIPAQPGTPVVTSLSRSSLRVSWEADENAQGYLIYRSTRRINPNFQQAATVKGWDSTHWVDTGLSANTDYYYVIAAYNGAGIGEKSAYSGAETARMPAASAPVLTALSESSVRVEWNAVPGAEGYYVYRAAEGGHFSKAAEILGGSVTDWTDTGLKDAVYIYQVEAYNEAGSGSRSECSKIEPSRPTPVPTATPTATPTAAPTPVPTPVPTATPTATPTAVPNVSGCFRAHKDTATIGGIYAMDGYVGVESGALAEVTVNVEGYDADVYPDSEVSKTFDGDMSLSLSDFSDVFAFDTGRAPFDTPGVYTVSLRVRTDDGLWTTVDSMELTTVVGNVTTTGYFENEVKTLTLGEAWTVDAVVIADGGSGRLRSVTVDAEDLSGAEMSGDFSGEYDRKISTEDWDAYRIDTDEAPWNVPGVYKLRLWADAYDGGAREPLDTMELVIVRDNTDLFGSVDGGKDYISRTSARLAMVLTEKSMDWDTVGKIRYVEQYGGRYTYDDYWGSVDPSEMCTRCAASMALSYMGISALPRYMRDEVETFYGSTVEEHGCKVDLNTGEIPVDRFIEWYNRYASDTEGKYSPVILHTRYYNRNRETVRPHALLIIGHDTYNPDYFYAADSGSKEVVRRLKLTVLDGKVRIEKIVNSNTMVFGEDYSMIRAAQYVKPDS